MTLLLHPSLDRRWRAIAGGMMVIALILCSFLTVAPDCHEWLHDNAAAPDHECALAVFSQQHVQVPGPSAEAPPLPETPVIALIRSSEPVVTSVSFSFSPSRAPPV